MKKNKIKYKKCEKGILESYNLIPQFIHQTNRMKTSQKT